MRHSKCIILFSIIFWQAMSQVSAQIKVACIGNSITYGQDLDRALAYPAVLQNLLGLDKYVVRNYAVSGTTILKDLHDNSGVETQLPYWEQIKYNEALDWRPDIVVIKFGTNDARVANWTSEQGKKVLYDTYVEFIMSFVKANPNVTVYISYPLPFLRTDNSRNKDREYQEQARVIREEVIPIIKQVARKNRVHLIDLHSQFYNSIHLTSDGVHPTEDGAELIAKEVFKMIKMTYNP